MRLKKVKGAEEKVEASTFVVHNSKEYKGKWHEFFGNSAPLFLEIGMGKGTFISTLSKLNPENNYLGMEKFSSVIVRAIEKQESDPEAPKNLFFLFDDAETLTDIFGKNEINTIYLNFSDPWPKARHEKRRLTSPNYLARYKEVLAPDGKIIFKTDNVELFDYSLESFKNAGWEIENVTYDLHHSEYAKGNVMTEYEEKFSRLGKKICRLAASKGADNMVSIGNETSEKEEVNSGKLDVDLT